MRQWLFRMVFPLLIRKMNNNKGRCMKLKIVAALMFSLALNAQADIKNEQHIIGGLLTRAGVKNQKPLSDSELRTLCEKGYTQAYFLYSGAPTKTVSCSKGEISYRSSGDFRKPENFNKILDNVERGLRTKEKTFVHCNNGAHASGYIAAVALKAFCGTSSESAVKYWDRTLSGYALQEPNRSKLMDRVRNYQPDGKYMLNAGQKSTFCN